MSHRSKHPEEGNVAFLCSDCGRKPDPKFADVPIETYLGGTVFCQLGVKCPDGRQENLWFKVIGRAEHEGEELRGELNNHPLYAEMTYGDLVEFSRKEILQVTA